jgi:hypothetical protein
MKTIRLSVLALRHQSAVLMLQSQFLLLLLLLL